MTWYFGSSIRVITHICLGSTSTSIWAFFGWDDWLRKAAVLLERITTLIFWQ